MTKSYFTKSPKRIAKFVEKKFFWNTLLHTLKKQSILPEFDKDEKLKKEAVWKLSFLKLRSDIASPVV